MNPDRPITILVCALGGEGGGVLAEWLVDTAIAQGHSVQSTSIPGVAQRTGATTYYVEVFPRPDAELGGKHPVFSLTPVPGALDLIASSELLETVRQIAGGMSNASRTQVISSRDRSLTTAEKMPLADGRADAALLARVVHEQSVEAFLLDMTAIAQGAGTVISAVLFGAIAASGVLPFDRESFHRTIRAGGKGVEASLRGFDAAFEALAALRHGSGSVVEATPALASGAPPGVEHRPTWLAEFPVAARETLALGHARVLEYQDARYAALYLERLHKVFAAERAGVDRGSSANANASAGAGAEADADADADGIAGATAGDDEALSSAFGSTTREVARHLALWMAFDDIVRVAELKCRASRHSRVRAEVKVGATDVLRIHDHFKPGVAEFAALLPTALAERVMRHERGRIARGKAPFALPIKLPSHAVVGLLALRALAAMKLWRRLGSRFVAEQAMIERWLAAVERGARTDAALGRELAACGRLIKGYGATNDRGKENLLHVVDHLAEAAVFDSPLARAAAIASAREAALADDAGKALDIALARHGAPPRPVREQAIHWVRRRPGGRAGSTPDGAKHAG